jgi:hypothetical protein
MYFSRQIPALARTTLSARLQPLIALGVFDTVTVSDISLYHEYVLTEKGRRLFPVVTALRQWGADYLFDESEQRQSLGIPVALVALHSVDGEPIAPEETQVVVCERGGATD